MQKYFFWKKQECLDVTKISSLSDAEEEKSWLNVINPSYKNRSESLKNLFTELPFDEHLLIGKLYTHIHQLEGTIEPYKILIIYYVIFCRLQLYTATRDSHQWQTLPDPKLPMFSCQLFWMGDVSNIEPK